MSFVEAFLIGFFLGPPALLLLAIACAKPAGKPVREARIPQSQIDRERRKMARVLLNLPDPDPW